MKLEETVTKIEMLGWYEGLVNFLQDRIPCLDELIQLYEEQDLGIDIRDRLMVGAYANELGEFFNRLIEEGGKEEYDSYGDKGEIISAYFDYMSPYYNSDVDDWFVGYRVNNEQEVGESLYESIRLLAEKFEEVTGVPAVLKGGAHVY